MLRLASGSLACSVLVACSFSPSAPATGGGDDDQPMIDAPSADDDAPAATADARACFGTSLVQVCPSAPPTGARTLPGGTAMPIDTDVDGNCTQVFPQTNGDEICVIAADTLTVAGAVTATGTRPLVLIGATKLEVLAGGSVDVSSTANRRGAGANHATVCNQAQFVAGNAEGDSGGGGGGAGGGFGTIGANGALGDDNDNHLPTPHKGVAGVAGGQQPAPTVLRGGCRGGSGGGGTINPATLGGSGGNGGGAVYLISAAEVAIAGNVFASGAGGRTNSGVAGFEQGGGGGGSGGMIGLDAPTIGITGILAANGGAGAGGGGNVGGAPGGDGTTVAFDTRAAKGAGDTGGLGTDGSDGTCVGGTTTTTPTTADAGGGGGGGGVGVVWIDGSVTGGTQISPPPTAH